MSKATKQAQPTLEEIKAESAANPHTAAAAFVANAVIAWLGELLQTGAIERKGEGVEMTDPECFDIACKCLPFKIRAALEQYTAASVTAAVTETPLVSADTALQAMQEIMTATAAEVWTEPVPAATTPAACQYCNANIDSGTACADCSDIAALYAEA